MAQAILPRGLLGPRRATSTRAASPLFPEESSSRLRRMLASFPTRWVSLYLASVFPRSGRKSLPEASSHLSVRPPSGGGSPRTRSALGTTAHGYSLATPPSRRRQAKCWTCTRDSGKDSRWPPPIVCSPPMKRPVSGLAIGFTRRCASSARHSDASGARVRAHGRLGVSGGVGRASGQDPWALRGQNRDRFFQASG
jgi:hypothetical protein